MTNKSKANQWLTRKQFAEMIGFTVQGVALLAVKKQGPPYYRPNGGRCLYRSDEVLAWIQSGRRDPASEPENTAAAEKADAK